jgi:hypothetical protein
MSRGAARRRGIRDEAGQLGGIEALAFGMLILIVGVLVVSNAWGVIDAKTAAREAAREGARTYATAQTSSPSQAAALAAEAAGTTLSDMGYSPAPGGNQLTQGVFQRCAVITWEVAVRVPAFRLPWIRSTYSFFTASAFESERVDPYRSGVPGDPANGGQATCTGGDVVPPTP